MWVCNYYIENLLKYMHLSLRKIHKYSYFVYYFRDFIEITKPFLWNTSLKFLKILLFFSFHAHVCLCHFRDGKTTIFIRSTNIWVLNVCLLKATYSKRLLICNLCNVCSQVIAQHGGKHGKLIVFMDSYHCFSFK